MLQRLYVHNYRCLENVEFNLEDISSALLIGKNGVGKSAIAFINKIVVITVYTYFFKGADIVKIIYDKEVDALSIIFQETTVTTQHLTEGIAIDYDQCGHLAGIEILDASQQFGGMETIRKVMLENIGLVGDYQQKVA